MPGRVQEEACPLAGAALGHCDWGPPGRRAAFSLTTEVWRAVTSRDSGLCGRSAALGDVFDRHSCRWRVLLPSRGRGRGRGAAPHSVPTAPSQDRSSCCPGCGGWESEPTATTSGDPLSLKSRPPKAVSQSRHGAPQGCSLWRGGRRGGPRALGRCCLGAAGASCCELCRQAAQRGARTVRRPRSRRHDQEAVETTNSCTKTTAPALGTRERGLLFLKN